MSRKTSARTFAMPEIEIVYMSRRDIVTSSNELDIVIDGQSLNSTSITYGSNVQQIPSYGVPVEEETGIIE